MFDADLLDTLTAAAKWNKIAGLVARSGWEVLFDDYEMKQGRNDLEFMEATFDHSIKFLHDLYVFRADQAKRKELGGLFRQIPACPAMQGPSVGPLSKMVWPLKQLVDEYEMLVKCGLDPPDEPRSTRNDSA